MRRSESTIPILVSPKWLSEHGRDRDLVVVDADPEEAYLRQHIPDAINLDLFDYIVADTRSSGLRKFQEDMTLAIGNAGITGDERIVVYEDWLGHRAPRVAWILEFLGHGDVHLLDGGFMDWRSAKLPLADKPRRLKPATFRSKPQPDLVAGVDWIHAKLGTGTLAVLDVRSKGEFTGTESRQCCVRPGRIPGSVWLEWTELLDRQLHFKEARSANAMLSRLGLSREKEVVTYCHRGARAASAYYALRNLGYEKVRNYIGSWHEWSSRVDLPAQRD